MELKAAPTGEGEAYPAPHVLGQKRNSTTGKLKNQKKLGAGVKPNFWGCVLREGSLRLADRRDYPGLLT